MKCELCNKSQKELNADTFYNEFLCDDCYSKYDYNKYPDAEQRHEIAWYKKIFTFNQKTI